MRVTLGTEEYMYQAGIFKRVPTWRVQCHIEFSPQELETIHKHGLSGYIIYTQTIHSSSGEEIKVYLKEVMKHGIWSTFSTLGEAKEFESLVREGTLPALKELIEEHATPLQGPQTFEL